MLYKNQYEYLNQEVRLPLLSVLKKYHLSEKDKEAVENILEYIFGQYDELNTICKFYEEKYGFNSADFPEFLKYFSKTHKKPVDYRKLSQKSVYGDDFDDVFLDESEDTKKLVHETAEKSGVDVERVVFNNPCTIVFWTDGDKTIVRCENEPFDKEKGLAMAICKKAYGNSSVYFEVFKKFCKEEDK